MIEKDDPCKVIGIENVKIEMFSDIVKTFYDVRHKPNFMDNLILLSTLNHNGFSFKFDDGILKVSKGVMIVMK